MRPAKAYNHYPGEAVLRRANIVLVNKPNTSLPAQTAKAVEVLRAVQPDVLVVTAASVVRLADPAAVNHRRALVVEDGPTIGNGDMPIGPEYAATEACEAAQIVNPRPYAEGSIAELCERFGHIGAVLCAMGYDAAQLAAMQGTINAADADVVVSGTPADITSLIQLN